MSHTAIHDHDEHSVRVMAGVRLAAVFSCRVGEDVDRIMRAYGWRRLGQWMPADDVLSGATQCRVEPASRITAVNGAAVGDRS